MARTEKRQGVCGRGDTGRKEMETAERTGAAEPEA